MCQTGKTSNDLHTYLLYLLTYPTERLCMQHSMIATWTWSASTSVASPNMSLTIEKNNRTLTCSTSSFATRTIRCLFECV